MEDVVFSQIDFGLLMPLLENDDITDISYSNNGQLWVKTLSRGVYAEHIEGLTNEVIEKLEKHIGEMDTVTNMLERGLSPEGILEEILGDFGLEITDTMTTQFYCDCSKEKVARALSTISKKDLDDIINDGESIEVKCQFCNSGYQFEIEELKEIRES